MPGPVIIADDGGPPLISKMRVTREGEDMPELAIQRTHPTKNVTAISQVRVIWSGQLILTVLSPMSVTVEGSDSDRTFISVQNSGGLIEISSSSVLNLNSASGWDRYETPYQCTIDHVQIDATVLSMPQGSQTRVFIYFE